VCYRPAVAANPLVELAREDARLFQLKQQIGNLPRRLAELGKERAALELQGREAEARLQNADTTRRKLDGELGEARAKKSKSEGRLASITSTDQYQALQKEIVTMTERVDALESQVLEAMERVEEATRQRDAEKARVAQALASLDVQHRQLSADLDRARAGLEEQNRKREQALSGIDARLRVMYERILKAKGDAGVSLVVAQSCGICKAKQPPQVVQQLRQAAGMQVCQMCGRILVWDPSGT
jgi:predicted  nucleic acid-binding Zn-ribbon protein